MATEQADRPIFKEMKTRCAEKEMYQLAEGGFPAKACPTIIPGRAL